MNKKPKKKNNILDELLLKPPQIAIASMNGDKGLIHQFNYYKNLVKNIKKIVPEHVKHILFQPYVGNRITYLTTKCPQGFCLRKILSFWRRL